MDEINFTVAPEKIPICCRLLHIISLVSSITYPSVASSSSYMGYNSETAAHHSSSCLSVCLPVRYSFSSESFLKPTTTTMSNEDTHSLNLTFPASFCHPSRHPVPTSNLAEFPPLLQRVWRISVSKLCHVWWAIRSLWMRRLTRVVSQLGKLGSRRAAYWGFINLGESPD